MIDKMNTTHKTRMKKKNEIIGITDQTTVKLDHAYYKKGSTIGKEFYLTIRRNKNGTFMHWEHGSQSENTDLSAHFTKWDENNGNK